MTKPNIEVKKLNTLTGHQDCVYALVPGTKSQFYSSGADGQVICWNMEDNESATLLAKVTSSVYAMKYIDDKQSLIVGQNFDGIHVINVKTKKHLGSLKLGKTAIFDIQEYDGNLIIACGNGWLYIVDLITLAIIKEYRFTEKSARCIAINPVERQFAVGYSDHLIRVFSLTTYELLSEIKGHENSVFTLSYSPDFKELLSAGRDAQLKIWDVQDKYTLKQSIPAHMYTINHIEFHPSGEYFVTCSMDKSMKIWDTTTFELLKVIDKARHAGHGTSVNKLLWTSFNNWLVSCSDDRTVSTWDINIGNQI